MYLAVRYFALCGYMAMSSLIFGNFTPNVCKNLNLAKEILMMSEELSVGCVLALRIFALYSFNKRVITIVIAAVMIGLSVAAWSIVTGNQVIKTTYDDSGFGCQLSQGPIAQYVYTKYTRVTIVCILCLDAAHGFKTGFASAWEAL
ncbi:hypothetical protein C8J57DRAFT_1478545 [Mycena rebaudengoi]|nr:hypothetical protein C8J57DRAFT_1478545 [Mycena rebaudengoi]